MCVCARVHAHVHTHVHERESTRESRWEGRGECVRARESVCVRERALLQGGTDSILSQPFPPSQSTSMAVCVYKPVCVNGLNSLHLISASSNNTVLHVCKILCSGYTHTHTHTHTHTYVTAYIMWSHQMCKQERENPKSSITADMQITPMRIILIMALSPSPISWPRWRTAVHMCQLHLGVWLICEERQKKTTKLSFNLHPFPFLSNRQMLHWHKHLTGHMSQNQTEL